MADRLSTFIRWVEGVVARSGADVSCVEFTCRRVQKISAPVIRAALAKPTGDGLIGAGVIKEDYADPIVVLRLDDFLRLVGGDV